MRFLAIILFAASCSAQLLSVTGRMIEESTKQPIRHIPVFLKSVPPGTTLGARTNEEGFFAISGVKPGRYTVSGSQGGHFTSIVNFTLTNESVEIGAVEMIRIRQISGNVRWEDGEPAIGAEVFVVSTLNNPSDPINIPRAGTPVNQKGDYTISGLRPGSYVVYASSSGKPSPAGFPLPVIPPTFYPAAASAQTAATLDLQTQDEAKSIDFILRPPQAGVTVGGTVISSSDYKDGAAIRAILFTDDALQTAVGTVDAVIGQPFEIRNVPPGQYQMMVHMGAGMDSTRRLMPLTVGTTDIRGLNLLAPEQKNVWVRAVVEERRGNFTGVPGVFIVATMAKYPKWGLGGTSTASEGKNLGAAHIPAIAAGETYNLNFPNGLPQGMYIDRLEQGTRRQTEGPFQIIANETVTTLYLVRGGGTVSGHIINDALGNTFVVLAPKNRADTIRYRTASSGPDGKFNLTAIAPGDYDLFAFDRNEQDQYKNPSYLAGFSSNAVPLTIDQGSRLEIETSAVLLRR